MIEVKSVETIVSMLAEQNQLLREYENAELARLAFLGGACPERAFPLAFQCQRIYEKVVDLDGRIDAAFSTLNLDDVPKAVEKRIAGLKKANRKQAKRALEVANQSQRQLKKVMDNLSEKIADVHIGKRAVNAYLPAQSNLKSSPFQLR